MALTAYVRFRYAWGLVDFTSDPDGPAYHAGNTQSPIAANILARRAVLEWDRSALGLDVAQTHVDIANITNGQLDDSWTDADFSSCETNLLAFWDAFKFHFHTSTVLDTIRWYRVGPGATPPEPAVRVKDVTVAGTGTTGPLPHQLAMNITLRTGLRKAWGRMYLPSPTSATVSGGGNILDTLVTTLGTAMNALVGNLAGSDFRVVVYSKVHQKAYAVEKVAVDNIFDTQRRRRHRQDSFRAVFP